MAANPEDLLSMDMMAAGGPGGAEPMLAEDGSPLDPAVERALRVQEFAVALLGKRSSAIQARTSSGVERRWMDDLDSYYGRDAFNRPPGIVEVAASGGAAVGTQWSNSATLAQQERARSTVFVQLTRQKTNAAAARVMDMLFPSDEKNWGIGPTPVPELQKAVSQHRNVAFRDPQTGMPLAHPDEARPLTAADVAADTMREAQERAERMEKEIADKLEECGYVAQGRQVVMDAAIMGTGILKGPVVVNGIKKAWSKVQDATGVVRTLTIEPENKPASFRVDPWDFFPDPSCGESIQNGAFAWEREWISGRKLRELARTEGYDRAAIRECLKEGPRRVANDGSSYYQSARGGDAYNQRSFPDFQDTRYELWTYCGEVAREDLEVLGVGVPEAQAEFLSLSAIVVFCNDRPIKALLNPLDTGDLPYDVFVWEKIALTPFGAGVPYLMRYAQRTINAAWRALMDNMAASSGVQLIMQRGLVPADGRPEITGRKLWWAPEGVDVERAFRAVEIPSRQAELTNIIRLAMEFADMETALPQIAQGEQGSAPDTVGGMTLLMNAASTVLKRLARQFDDMVTKPHIRRYYDWMMQYGESDEIKGDYQVAARGSTALVQRDVRNQSLTEVLASATHPVFGVFVDSRKLFRQYLESKYIAPDSVMKTDADIEAAMEAARKAGPQPSPQEKVAQIRAQADVQKMQIDTQSEATNERLRQENAERDRQHDMTLKILDYRTKMLDYAHQRQMSLEDLKAELAMLTLEKSFTREESMIDRAEQRANAEQGRTHEMNREALRASQRAGVKPA